MGSWKKIKVLAAKLPPQLSVQVNSFGRQIFVNSLKNERVSKPFVPGGLSRRLWDLEFRSPLFNSAGVFKDFSCYDLAFKQGAGAYLVGTLTPEPRSGNTIDGIYLPFVLYPKSHSSSNSLGLPNKGIKEVLREILERREGFPIGVSLASESLEDLVHSLQLCEEKGIDFVEINESCPNIRYAGELTKRLEYVRNNFIRKRKSAAPIIVKFSNDLKMEQIPDVLDVLIVLGFDGINRGNTSTDYESARIKMHLSELRLFDYYTKNFQGGISGRPLRESSLQLSQIAREYLETIPLSREFHVIRTGGIETASDLGESQKAGISLNEWFTGYFEGYLQSKDSVYRKAFEG